MYPPKVVPHWLLQPSGSRMTSPSIPSTSSIVMARSMIASNNVELMHPRVSVNAACFGSAPLPVVAGYWRELAPRQIGLVGPLLDDQAAALEVVESGGYAVETIAHLLFPG